MNDARRRGRTAFRGAVLLAGACAAAVAWAAGCAASKAGGGAPDGPVARSLFDGASLDGWAGDPLHWRVEGGLLTGETRAEAPIAHNTFLIRRTPTTGDFVLEFDYVVQSAWANSGVQYRSVEWPAATDQDRWIVGGYQADIDEPAVYTGILYGERDRGILALRGQQVEIAPGGKPNVVGAIGDAAALAKAIHGRGEWNHYRVAVTGNHIVHEINGQRMVDVVDNDAPAAAHDQHGSRPGGVIAFQLHTGQPMKIQFRNVRLTETK